MTATVPGVSPRSIENMLPSVERPHLGEALEIVERLLLNDVSSGVFHVAREALRGTRIEVGDVVGTVDGAPIRSGFAGTLMGVMVLDGHRVALRQAVAWLRGT